jgi:hypothetical protein
MVQLTSTIVAVPSQAHTQKSPVGVAWSTNALTACSLGIRMIRSQDSESPPSHGPIVLRCPGNGREPPMGTVINPQRGLMQDVGPEVLLHVPELSPPLFLWHILMNSAITLTRVHMVRIRFAMRLVGRVFHSIRDSA